MHKSDVLFIVPYQNLERLLEESELSLSLAAQRDADLEMTRKQAEGCTQSQNSHVSACFWALRRV